MFYYIWLSPLFLSGDREPPSSPDSQNNQNSANTPQPDGPPSPVNHGTTQGHGKTHKGGGPLRHKKGKNKVRHRYCDFK